MSSPCSGPARRRNCCSPPPTGAASSPPPAGAIAETRKGRQIVNLKPGAKLRSCDRSAQGDDYVAVIGENRKLVVYPLERTAGDGPRPGRPAAALPRRRPCRREQLRAAEGLSWPMGGEGGRTRTEDMNPGAPRAAPPAGCRPRASRGTTLRLMPAGSARVNSSLPAHNVIQFFAHRSICCSCCSA